MAIVQGNLIQKIGTLKTNPVLTGPLPLYAPNPCVTATTSATTTLPMLAPDGIISWGNKKLPSWRKALKKIKIPGETAQPVEGKHTWRYIPADEAVAAFADFSFMKKGVPHPLVLSLIWAGTHPHHSEHLYECYQNGLAWQLPPIPYRAKCDYLLTKAGLAVVDLAASKHKRIKEMVDIWIKKKQRNDIESNTNVLYFGGIPEALANRMKLAERYEGMAKLFEERKLANKIAYAKRVSAEKARSNLLGNYTTTLRVQTKV